MKTIQLTQCYATSVDNDDYDELMQHKWHADIKHKKSHMTVTAVRCEYIKKRKYKIYMHRQIMGFPIGKQIDHKNHDTLDNRRSNLRICSPQENTRNKRGYNKNGFKGLCKQPGTNKYAARIALYGKTIYLGVFDTAVEAARCYDTAARREFGEFAHLNFP